ncbi:MarR family transcriptional regulator [Nocardia sp. NPDC051756]|uniref:MarR family winged helix-turn-helix transcriptional regulator n=1 Tax=Nocardia sp. NPDC051756 TaxID=3154751 RepID=UPI0034335455
MTEGRADRQRRERAELETVIARDIRALTAASEQIGHVFARANALRPNDFRALMLVAVADIEGAPLTSGQLGELLGVSSAAVTYLVERMIASGHLRREADESDRRKVLLRYDAHGMAVARGFFTPLGERTRAAMARFDDRALDTAHQVMVALIGALREHYDDPPDEPS